jgi:hypothetical protein
MHPSAGQGALFDKKASRFGAALVLPQACALQKQAFLGNGISYTLCHAQFPTHTPCSMQWSPCWNVTSRYFGYVLLSNGRNVHYSWWYINTVMHDTFREGMLQSRANAVCTAAERCTVQSTNKTNILTPCTAAIRCAWQKGSTRTIYYAQVHAQTHLLRWAFRGLIDLSHIICIIQLL